MPLVAQSDPEGRQKQQEPDDRDRGLRARLLSIQFAFASLAAIVLSCGLLLGGSPSNTVPAHVTGPAATSCDLCSSVNLAVSADSLH